jgi:transmembrane sensor
MAKQPFIAKDLLEKYRNGTCTEQEAALVEQWYETIHSEEFDLPEQILADNLGTAWNSIQEKKRARRTLKLWKGFTIAAAILLVTSAGHYFYKLKISRPDLNEMVIADVAPGGNRATLTLANGKIIALGGHKDSIILAERGMKISQTVSGQLVYHVTGDKTEHQGAFNTITTPKGGQYQVQLPDKSIVWLNAATSLRYATSLNERGERRVWLESGEAYFEIEKDQRHPFIVSSGGQEVEVLGTHFNINAYKDEKAVKTTLLEGSVRVRSTVKGVTSKIASQQNARNDVILKPGQQSVFDKGTINITEADTETATGWKEGLFVFQDADVPTVMRQISRWYGIEVEYKGAIPKDLFTGGISRQSNLSTVLKMLELIKIRSRIIQTENGKKLIINP